MKMLKAAGLFLLFCVLTLVLQGVVQIAFIKVTHYRPTDGWNPGDFALSDGIGFLCALAMTAIFAHFERRPVGSYGLPLVPAAGPRFVEGLVWGAAAVALTLGGVIAAGGAHIAGLALPQNALLRSGAAWLGTMIILGFFEEYTFRGYALDALTRGFGFRTAAVINGILFGALHYFTKPMENAADAISIAIITIFLCVTIARTGSLWFAIGFHAAFDYVALVVFAAPNTGNNGKPIDGHLLNVAYTGPAWLTGGPRGLEASAPIFVVMALLFAAYHVRSRRAKAATSDGL